MLKEARTIYEAPNDEAIVGAINGVTEALNAINQTLKDLPMALTKVVFHVKVVKANAPPQYNGPTDWLDGVVGGTDNPGQFGFDPDGDPITWSAADNPLFTMSEAGVMTYTGEGEMDVEVTLDDGKG